MEAFTQLMSEKENDPDIEKFMKQMM